VVDFEEIPRAAPLAIRADEGTLHPVARYDLAQGGLRDVSRIRRAARSARTLGLSEATRSCSMTSYRPLRRPRVRVPSRARRSLHSVRYSGGFSSGSDGFVGGFCGGGFRLIGRSGADEAAEAGDVGSGVADGAGGGGVSTEADGACVVGAVDVEVVAIGSGASRSLSSVRMRLPAKKPPMATPTTAIKMRNVRDPLLFFSLARRCGSRVGVDASRIELGIGSICAGVRGSDTPPVPEDGGSGAVFGPPGNGTRTLAGVPDAGKRTLDGSGVGCALDGGPFAGASDVRPPLAF
jgi:hypothetical protein